MRSRPAANWSAVLARNLVSARHFGIAAISGLVAYRSSSVTTLSPAAIAALLLRYEAAPAVLFEGFIVEYRRVDQTDVAKP